MTAQSVLLALGAGFLVAVVTTPVGVSGAVFLLPVQLDVLRVPSPSVTPTNLLFNVVSVPGALLRGTGGFGGDLARRLLTGTLPGVLVGTVVRIYAAPGDQVFRILAAALLLPLGVWLCLGGRTRDREPRTPAARTIVALGFATGIVGGVYGIGGGSLIGPILVGAGMTVAVVAPAALTATFLTSVLGVLTYGLLGLVADGPVGPDWPTGLSCGLGGLAGGWVGAQLRPRIPEHVLRTGLGVLAVGLAAVYLVRAVGP